MALLQPDHALELLRGIVDSSPAAATEATLECVEDRFVRFADGGPTQSADRERYELSIRVRLPPATDRGAFAGWREARASCGTLDPESTRATLGRALTLAEVAAPNPDLVPMGGAVEVRGSAADRPTLDHSFREKAQWIERALAACSERDLAPAGLARTTGISRTLVSSEGRAVTGARSRAAFALTATTRGEESRAGAGDGEGFAEAIRSSVGRVDPDAVIERAVHKAVESRSPAEVEPGEYTVVLEPAAVSALVLFAGYQGFGAREVHEKSSFLCGRVGEQLFPEGLTILDDAGNEVYPGLPFDGEGCPKRRLALLEGGALRGPVTDERWSRKLGVENTGHARPQPSPDGPAANNLVVAPGRDSVEALVAGVQRGLLVSQLHYTNLIEPRELVLTGTTRNGTFLIENGRIARPVQNLRFTQSLVQALRGVSGVGNALEVAGALFEGEVVCPALRLERFRFTSTTEF